MLDRAVPNGWPLDADPLGVTVSGRFAPALALRSGPGRPLLLMAFLAAFVVCTLIVQINSSTLPGEPGSAIDYFTSAELWLLSFISLLTASRYTWSDRALLFWLAACAGLALLAIDEVFEKHEQTKHLIGDDDYFKIGAWLAAAVALHVVVRLERPALMFRNAILAGYLCHSLYILVDVGDGDLYSLTMFSQTTLDWAEELLELAFLTCYLFGFSGFLPRPELAGRARPASSETGMP